MGGGRCVRGGGGGGFAHTIICQLMPHVNHLSSSGYPFVYQLSTNVNHVSMGLDQLSTTPTNQLTAPSDQTNSATNQPTKQQLNNQPPNQAT